MNLCNADWKTIQTRVDDISAKLEDPEANDINAAFGARSKYVLNAAQKFSRRQPEHLISRLVKDISGSLPDHHN